MKTQTPPLPDGYRLKPGERAFFMQRSFAGQMMEIGPSFASTKPPRTAPNIPGNSDVNDLYSGNPETDCMLNGGPGDGRKLCSVYSLCRAAGCHDSSFAKDMVSKRSLSPDETLSGVPHWNQGQSANAASQKLKSAYAVHVAATKPKAAFANSLRSRSYR